MDKHEARAAILAHAETIDWSVPPTLEEQNATLRAQLAEVTRERDGLLLRAYRLGWLAQELPPEYIYYVLGDFWDMRLETLEESIRAAMEEQMP